MKINSGDGNGWIDYSQHPLRQPDHKIARGSPGYATMQYLLRLGATYDQNPGDNYPINE